MKHEFWVQWGGLGAFIAKHSDTTSWHELLHHFGQFCIEFFTATKRSRMHPNSTIHTKHKSLESNGMDQLRSLRKIPKRLRGTNFCTISASLAPSFVRQPNGPKCTRIVQNVSLGSNGVDRVLSLRKIPMQRCGTKFCTSSARFAPSFVRQPNGPESTQIVRNGPKH